jgi:predicted O-methyltransferase YrrM
LVDRGLLVSRLLVRDPLLLGDYARWYATARIGRSQEMVHRALPGAITPDTAKAELRRRLGPWEEGPALARVRAFRAAPAAAPAAARLGALMAGDPSLGELLYGLVRALRPPVVVETGVATGVTSAYLLAALADNGTGRLHSIDLPATALLTNGLVGSAVPPALHERWVYHWGAAHRLLPRVMRERGGALRLFVHDSDHRYAPMRSELARAWDALAPGGWLVADDVDYNDAFAAAAAAVGATPLYVRQTTKPATTGLIHKSA